MKKKAVLQGRRWYSHVTQVHCFLIFGPQVAASESTDFFSQDGQRFSHSEIRGLDKKAHK